MNGIDGIYINDITFGLEGPNDQTTAVEFDGRGSYVIIPYTPLINSSNFSISATVKPQSSGNAATGRPESIVENFAEMSQETVIIGGYGLERHWVQSNFADPARPRWAFIVGTPLGPQTLLSTSDAKDGKWAQVVGVYNAQTRTARLYVNGELEDSVTLGNQVRIVGWDEGGEGLGIYSAPLSV